MERPIERGDTLEQREESARHALHEYRERRRRRRADDTFFGSTECLLPRDESEAQHREMERRRVDLMADAEEIGMSTELAELLYDIAREEGLDPGIAFELVRTGLGVAPPLDGISNAPDQPVIDRYLPAWMFPAEPTDRLLRERMLRVSFRRLRSLLEEEQDADAALRRFAAEPDVGHYGY